MTRPATAMSVPAPARGSRQQMADNSQFSASVTDSGSVRPKSRKTAKPNRQRIAPSTPKTAAITRQAVSRSGGLSSRVAGRSGGDAVDADCSISSSAGVVTEGRGAPHSPQKLSPSRSTAPQLSHWIGRVMISLPGGPWGFPCAPSRQPATGCLAWRPAGGGPRYPLRQSGTCRPHHPAGSRICCGPERWRVRCYGPSLRCPGSVCGK